MSTHFSTENPTKLMELESYLANNLYLSGEALPNQEDSRIVESLKDAPDRSKYPNLFAYWWNLCLFQPNARELWCTKGHKDQKDHKEEHKDEKKGKGKPAPKKAAPQPAEEEDDDDVDADDLFGGVTEEDKKALEADQKKKDEDKKKKAKVVVQKSRVTFDVKGYEVDMDFDGLATKIFAAVQKDGLIWQDSYEIIPIGFGIKCLRLTMIIEDDKISTDDIMDQIKDSWEDDVQSCDIFEFNKV